MEGTCEYGSGATELFSWLVGSSVSQSVSSFVS
jgi:hypothetical protein